MSPAKHTITAHRVLVVLQWLFQHGTLSPNQLNDALIQQFERGVGSETLTKYINTLRQAGCDIPRAGSANGWAYQLARSPFPVETSTDEVTAVLEALTATLLHPQCQPAWLEAWLRVLWALDLPNDSSLASLRDDLKLACLSPPAGWGPAALAEVNSQIQQWQAYCDAGLALSMVYQPPQLKESFHLTLDPVELRGQESDLGLQLVGVCRQTGQQRVVFTQWASQVRQLPVKRQHRCQVVRVVFELRGKLASTYRAYPGETIVARSGLNDASSKGSPSYLRMAHATTQLEALLQRLMKYGGLCEVLSPDHVRHQVHQKIRTMVGFNQQLAPNT